MGPRAVRGSRAASASAGLPARLVRRRRPGSTVDLRIERARDRRRILIREHAGHGERAAACCGRAARACASTCAAGSL